MSIITPTNFNVQAQSHIDSRLIQADITARDLISVPTRYWGMQVHVLDSDGSNNPNTYILQKGSTDTDISNNANWIPFSAASVTGLDKEVQYNKSGVMGSSSTFYYDDSLFLLVAANDSSSPHNFTGAHSQAGSWSALLGENFDFTGGQRSVNTLAAGYNHRIGASGYASGSGSGQIISGIDHDAYGVYGANIGFSTRTEGVGSIAIGQGSFGGPGGTGLPNKRLLVVGQGGISLSTNTSGQVDFDGNYANYGTIIGGTNAHLPVNSTRSVVLGGDSIKAPDSVPNTVFMPKVRIGLGTSGSITQNDTEDQIAVINSTSGEIQWRDASTISGGWATTGTTTLTGDTVITATDNYVEFDIESTNTGQPLVAIGQNLYDGYWNLGTGDLIAGFWMNSRSVATSAHIKILADNLISGYNSNIIELQTHALDLKLFDGTAFDSATFTLTNSAGITFALEKNHATANYQMNAGVVDLATTDQTLFSLKGGVNKLTSGNYTGLKLDITETDVNTGNFLMDLQTDSTSKFKVASDGGVQISGDTTQTIKTAHIQLSQSQIQNLGTTPVQIVAGSANVFFQLIGGFVYYDHNGTNYTGGSQLYITGSGNASVFGATTAAFISHTSDLSQVLSQPSSANAFLAGNDLEIEADANSTGAGGTMDVYIQYVEIDTN